MVRPIASGCFFGGSPTGMKYNLLWKKIFGNPEIVKRGIGVPDYVKLSQALKEKYYTEREIEITEGPTIEMVKEVLKI